MTAPFPGPGSQTWSCHRAVLVALALGTVAAAAWAIVGIAPTDRLVAVLVLHFLSGYLQGSLYLAAAVAVYFVFSAIWRDQSIARVPRWAPLAQLALLAVLGAAAAAFQLLPTATLVAQAGRSAGFPLGHVHDVENRAVEPAVSVHAYSPPLTAMSYYSVTPDGRLRRTRSELVTAGGAA